MWWNLQVNNMCTIYFDSAVYSADAIKKSSYEYWDKCETIIELCDLIYKVTFINIPENDCEIHQMIFRQRVIDNQLRLDVLRRTGKVRELIIAQAFAPIENYDDIIKASLSEE
jgi:His-Xaa-Ser system protein HxsD